MSVPKTIKEAQSKGYRVTREVRYYAEKDGMQYMLPYESRNDYIYNWRKFPGKRKKP